jgi:hypothetical protein
MTVGMPATSALGSVAEAGTIGISPDNTVGHPAPAADVINLFASHNSMYT